MRDDLMIDITEMNQPRHSLMILEDTPGRAFAYLTLHRRHSATEYRWPAGTIGAPMNDCNDWADQLLATECGCPTCGIGDVIR